METTTLLMVAILHRVSSSGVGAIPSDEIQETILNSSRALHLFPWQVFPDQVVLDWLIRLRDKDRLLGCTLRYASDLEGNITIMGNFLPLYRTIKVGQLRSNTSYWMQLVCRDREYELYSSKNISFTTGIPTM